VIIIGIKFFIPLFNATAYQNFEFDMVILSKTTLY